MARLVRVGDLEVPQDLRLERHGHALRRVAAVLGVLVLVAAVLGFLGGKGVFAANTIRTASGGATLTYDRFAQYTSPSELRVHLATGVGGTQRIAFSNRYLDGVEVQQTSAQPLSVTTLSDRTVYAFDVRPPADVTFSIQPQSIGIRKGVVYGPDGSSAPFTQWVYP